MPAHESTQQRLQQYLSEVRRRVLAQSASRGIGIAAIVALAGTILAVLGANAWRFSGTATGVASALLWLGVVTAVAAFLIRPLLRRPSDKKIAQFVEEKHPEFQDRLVTAAELRDKSSNDPNARVFQELVVEDAMRRAPQAAPTSLIEPRRIFRPLVWAAGSVAIIVLLGLFGPGIFRYGTKVLWIGWAQAKVNPLYEIQVTPGDVTVGRNTDQEVTAQPVGFFPADMKLFVQYEKAPNWESAAMLSASAGSSFHFLLMNVQQKIDYYVESNGVRSAKHTISVIQVPRVESLDVRYHFPAYSGLADRTEPSSGDIQALKGTEVTLTVHTDAPSSGGRLALDDKSTIALSRSGERELQAQWTLTQDTLYHVQLQDLQGREARASQEYLMQAIPDLGPSVKITRPGHDLQPTPIEEVVLGLEGQDDVRLADLSLHYSINGGRENAVSLPITTKPTESGQQASGTYLLPLEEYSLSPGDLITYYGTARDAASNTTSTDIFFLQVRPFERNYTQSQTAAGGGSGQSNQDTFLSEREKEVISATWNILHQKDHQTPDQLTEGAKVLSQVQRDLAEQADTLAGRIGKRELDSVNDEFSGLTDNLKKAVEAMGPAADLLEHQKFQDALTPEQTALQALLRAEASFKDIQVAFGNQGGGAGGGKAGRDLSDLFSLELDTSKNQYETLNQYSGNQNSAEVQDALRKLEELARRQEELSQQQNQKDSLRSANRWEQEMLRRDTEELARKLDQLSRQTNSSQLGQASRSLSQAARDMQQAGSAGQQGSSQQQGSSGQQSASSDGSSERSRALERLREASNMLSGQKNNWDQQRLQELSDQAENLDKLQGEISDQTDRLASQNKQGSTSLTPDTRQALSQIMDDKQKLSEGLRDLQQQIGQSAARMAGDQKKTAADLRSAASTIQDERLADKITAGAWLTQRGLWPTAAPMERELKGNLDQMKNQLAQAQRSFQGGGGSDEKLQRALETAERVRQGLEAVSPRTGQQGRPGQQGQNGQGNQQNQQAGQQGQGQQGQGQQQANNGNQQGQQGNGGQGSSLSAQGGQRGGGWNPASPHGGYGNGFVGGGPVDRSNANASNDGGSRPLPPDQPLTAEEQRALDQQYRELARDAAGLKDLLAQEPDFSKMAQDLVRSMQDLDARQFGNTQQLEALQNELTDRWKDLELRLRRELQMEEPDAVKLATQERVPEKYRAIVEEYYRSISKSKK
jgi:hypothetical protein